MNKAMALGTAAMPLALTALLLGSSAPSQHRTIGGQSAAPRSAFAGAKPSFAMRNWGKMHRMLQFSSAFQHVVVIVMENRTVDNLFSGYYGQPFPGGGTWDTALNLYNPNNVSQPLTQNSLSAHFDPNHGHRAGFETEAAGLWSQETFGCPGKPPVCPPGTTAFSYVPTSETNPYQQLITNWAFANNVYQSNEGPSFPNHQYQIAAQSGGIPNSLTAPLSEAENPQHEPGGVYPTQNYTEDNSFDLVPGGAFCYQTVNVTNTLDMTQPYTQNELSNPEIVPCEEYPPNNQGTVLDQMGLKLGIPPYDDWQYVAHTVGSIWAAPMAVKHLYAAYAQAPDKSTQPFAVDPDAVNFVNSLSGHGNPQRPFAQLTFITPCGKESDHPILGGTADGPAWLAYVVNAIGQSTYWQHTAIVVTWDDWGGFYDHVPNVPPPFHPYPNGYPIPGHPFGNPSDPYEYGFRVPLMLIAPYVRGRAYVSTQMRSQSAIVHFIEDVFNLPSLNADDAYNDDLSDMINVQQQPLQYIPVTAPMPNLSC
jgi:phospholipase C